MGEIYLSYQILFVVIDGLYKRVFGCVISALASRSRVLKSKSLIMLVVIDGQYCRSLHKCIIVKLCLSVNY